MRKELVIAKNNINDEEIDEFFQSANLFDRVCVPGSFYNEFSKLANVSGLIDFPFGLSSSKTRIFEINQAAKFNIKTVDLVLNHYFINSNSLNKLIKDVDLCIKTCKSNGQNLRLIVEYSILDPLKINELIDVLKFLDIHGIITSTSTFAGNTNDEAIIANKIFFESKIPVYCGNCWNPNHIDLFKSSGAIGLRFSSIKLFKNLKIGVY